MAWKEAAEWTKSLPLLPPPLLLQQWIRPCLLQIKPSSRVFIVVKIGNKVSLRRSHPAETWIRVDQWISGKIRELTELFGDCGFVHLYVRAREVKSAAVS